MNKTFETFRLPQKIALVWSFLLEALFSLMISASDFHLLNLLRLPFSVVVLTFASPIFFTVHSPRELDLARLLESCKQLYPLDLLNEPSVQGIKRFLDRLAEWRQESWQTTNSVCHLILSTSTRSLGIASAGTKRVENDPVGEKMDKEDQACLLLSRTVNKFYSEYPRFAPRIPEWNTLSLVS